MNLVNMVNAVNAVNAVERRGPGDVASPGPPDQVSSSPSPAPFSSSSILSSGAESNNSTTHSSM